MERDCSDLPPWFKSSLVTKSYFFWSYSYSGGQNPFQSEWCVDYTIIHLQPIHHISFASFSGSLQGSLKTHHSGQTVVLFVLLFVLFFCRCPSSWPRASNGPLQQRNPVMFLTCTRQCIASRSRGVIFPLYSLTTVHRWDTSGVLGPVLGSLVQQIRGHAGVRSAKGHGYD